MPASARVPNMATLLGIVLVWSIASTAVGAHESWINRGGYRNSAGEWCCGDNDCGSPGQIAVTGKVGSSAARNSSRSTRPRQVRTGRSGSAAGPITHAVVFSGRHPARSRDGLAARSDKFQQDFISRPSRAETSKVPRGQRAVPEDRGKDPRDLVCAILPAGVAASNAPQTRPGAFRAQSRCIRRDYRPGLFTRR